MAAVGAGSVRAVFGSLTDPLFATRASNSAIIAKYTALGWTAGHAEELGEIDDEGAAGGCCCCWLADIAVVEEVGDGEGAGTT